MYTIELPKGTVLTLFGFPVVLSEDTKVESATPESVILSLDFKSDTNN